MKRKFIIASLLFSTVSVVFGKVHYDNKINSIGEQAVASYEKEKDQEKQTKKDALNKLSEKMYKAEFDAIDIDTVESKFFKRLDYDETLTIVFLGDSTTEQNVQTNGKPGHVKTIENQLKNIYGDKIRVVNAGVSGNTIVDMAARLNESVLRYNPDLVVINSGLNDVSKTDSKNFKDKYRYILDRIKKETDAEVILRTSNPTDVEETNIRLEEDINPIVAELANEYKLGFVDLYQYYKQQISNHGVDYYNNDDYHPNEKGQQLISELLLYALIKN